MRKAASVLVGVIANMIFQACATFYEPWQSILGVLVGGLVVGIIVQQRAWLYGLISGMLAAIFTMWLTAYGAPELLGPGPKIAFMHDPYYMVTRVCEPILAMLAAESIARVRFRRAQVKPV